MTTRFADTSYYIALVNARDELHEKAIEIARQFRGHIVTTDYILIELGNWLSHSGDRQIFVETVSRIREDIHTTIHPGSGALFQHGYELFSSRSDKNWSMTDCISIVVMQERGITEAMSADHHFEQAGFHILLK